MQKIATAILLGASFALFGCAAPTVEQRGLGLQAFPAAEQLKIASARPLSLRTETMNQGCDVTTFFQIMSERFPEIQNILDVHYSEVERPEKTECSYWGIGVTYEGVASSGVPAANPEPISNAAETTVTTSTVQPVAEIPVAVETPKETAPVADTTAKTPASEAPAVETPAAPAQDSAKAVDPEAAKQAEILKLFMQLQAEAAKADSAKPAAQPAPAQN